tara:strand:+ start:1104 stop:1412 length:309 start_codon:yes stop_codon:yes gene_type:complete
MRNNKQRIEDKMNKRIESYLPETRKYINSLDFDKKIDRQEASKIIRTVILEIMEDWVNGKGGNFNLQLSKIVNFLTAILNDQFPKKQILEQIEEFLNQKEVA